MRPRSPLPFTANLHASPSTELHGEIQELAAEETHAQGQHEAEQPQRVGGPMLGELLAMERQQEEAERSQRTQPLPPSLPNGGAAMKRLRERAARQHPATRAEQWRARVHGTPKPIEGKRRETFEALVLADVLALAEVDKVELWEAADTIRAAIVKETLGQNILPEDRKLLLEVLDQIAMHLDHLYKRLNLRITPETLPAFTNTQVLEKPARLGSGSLNTVFGVRLRSPDGSVFDGIFKPLGATKQGMVAASAGIPKEDPQTALRNIATVSYVRTLGLDVIVDTRLAVIDTGRGIADPDLGLIMERARGKPAAQVDASVFTRADVCAEVTKLQLLDHLTGEGDRHANNYFINIEPNGRAKVMGIDNDQCFGRNLTDPADIQAIDDRDTAFHGTGLPPVVDTEMKRTINALTTRDIRWMLGNKLNEAEIKAAISRHRGLMNHIEHLRLAGWVIEPAQWSDPSVQQLLNAQNSYVGRERERALANNRPHAEATMQVLGATTGEIHTHE